MPNAGISGKQLLRIAGWYVRGVAVWRLWHYYRRGCRITAGEFVDGDEEPTAWTTTAS
jgi:hypothetical protein